LREGALRNDNIKVGFSPETKKFMLYTLDTMKDYHNATLFDTSLSNEDLFVN